MRRGPRSGMRRRASADAAVRGPRNRVVRRTCSWGRTLQRDGAQMIKAGGKRDQFTACFLRRDPDSLVALPATRQHIFREARKQVGRERRLLQGKGVIGLWD